MDADRKFGTVKWFSRIKGYGFIAPDDQEQEIFVHFSGIEGEGYRNLEKGQRVSFQVEETEKGPQAVNVRDQMVDEYTPGAAGMGGVATFEPDEDSGMAMGTEGTLEEPDEDSGMGMETEGPPEEPDEEGGMAMGTEGTPEEPDDDMGFESALEESTDEADDEGFDEMEEDVSGDEPPDIIA